MEMKGSQHSLGETITTFGLKVSSFVSGHHIQIRKTMRDAVSASMKYSFGPYGEGSNQNPSKGHRHE